MKKLGAADGAAAELAACVRGPSAAPDADDAGGSRRGADVPTRPRRLARPRRAAGVAVTWSTIPTACPAWSSGCARRRSSALDTETIVARSARRRAGRPLARREPDRGLVSAVRPPPAGRRARGARPGEEPAAAHATPRSRRSSRCSPIRRSRRSATTSSTTGRCCAGRAWSSRASRTTRCSRASCSIRAAARTPSTSSASSTRAHDAGLRGRGREGEGADPVRRGAGARPRRPTAAPTAPRCSRCTSSSRPRSARCAMEPLLRDDRDAARAGARRHGMGGHRHRPRALRAARRRARRAISGGSRARSPAWPARSSTSTHPRSSRRAVREAPAAGPQEDQDRPVHRRRRAGAARRHGARGAAAHPRDTASCRSSRAPTSTRCR